MNNGAAEESSEFKSRGILRKQIDKDSAPKFPLFSRNIVSPSKSKIPTSTTPTTSPKGIFRERTPSSLKFKDCPNKVIHSPAKIAQRTRSKSNIELIKNKTQLPICTVPKSASALIPPKAPLSSRPSSALKSVSNSTLHGVPHKLGETPSYLRKPSKFIRERQMADKMKSFVAQKKKLTEEQTKTLDLYNDIVELQTKYPRSVTVKEIEKLELVTITSTADGGDNKMILSNKPNHDCLLSRPNCDEVPSDASSTSVIVFVEFEVNKISDSYITLCQNMIDMCCNILKNIEEVRIFVCC